MPDLHHLLLFIAAGWLLNLTPGPDVLYIVSNALRSGARAGIVAGLGITTGCFVHVFAAAVGVGALLAASAIAFTVLKWVGAAYLVWIGVKLLLARAPQATADLAALARAQPASLRAVFLGGFWTNVLNPKVAIFFLAFVPQFIAPEAPNKALAFVLLGALFNFNSIPVNSGWALAAAWMARRQSVQRGLHWLDRAAGLMFVGFGVRLALTDAPRGA
ncbi:LysE family translocator [Ramlibacter sp.]|uniref:LysE family translocator n=1 Tax=Ramlibacter sp. TaxID=1917967 RepID=UPI002D47A0B3|nr:LysE family translocator [Ramlibacter sp.]HYD76724.1 LysE family translocator [Ramlibacter sp.]